MITRTLRPLLAVALSFGLLAAHGQVTTEKAPPGETAKSAKSAEKAPAEKAVDAPAKRCSVWTATKDGRTLHLTGSVHVGDKDMFPLPAAYENAFEASDIVVFETDLKKMSGIFAQMRMLRLSKYQDGTTLDDHLKPETLKKFKALLDDAGLPYGMVKSMQPFMATTMLSMVELQKLGYGPENGVDSHIDKRARKAKKTVKGLEGMDFYTKLFPSLPHDEQVAMLEQGIDDFDSLEKEFKEMMTHWRAGNAEHMEAFMKKGMAGIEAIENKLLYDRNKAWIPKLTAFHKEHDDVMVVVGAAHLVGEDSVCELLEKEGFTIQQAGVPAPAKATE